MTRLRPACGGLEAHILLRMLAAHAIPGVEEVHPGTGRYRRTLGPDLLTLRLDAAGVELEAAGPTDRGVLQERVRRWFDLDADLGAVGAHLGADEALRPLIAARPQLRVLEYPDPFEAAVVTVLGQQVSVAAARTFAGRLVAALGSDGPGGLRSFPSAATVAAADPARLQAAVGITHTRTRTLRAVAAAFADLARDPRPLERHELMALPGIGPWSADYLAVRSTGNRDGFTPGDLVLRRALGVSTPAEATARAEPWRPYRAYALFHLWVGAAYLR